MKCPACPENLTFINVGGLTVDVCQEGCGGIWFDNRELQRVDEASELDLDPLLNIRHDLSVMVDFKARRPCPRCEDVVLMRHGYAGNREVQVDACASCGGIWLDSGELAQIRENSKEAERKSASPDYFKQLISQQRERGSRQAG